jgi:tetratricopeptide (TPR) repeat protein
LALKTNARIILALVTAIACALGQSLAVGRDIHYGAVSDEDIFACDQLHWRGQIEDSRNCYANLLRSSTLLPVRAEAAWALKDLQAANSWFQQAMRENPDDVATRVRWGDLYADSHQDAEAMDIYREALERDESNVFALLGAARVLAGGFDDAANAFLTPLLTDPTTPDGARTGALLLSARVALEDGNRDEALAALDDAAEIVERNDWPPLEIYALRAAADLMNNVTESRWTAMSLEYNPHYGGIYAVPAYIYVITRRYREAIDLYQKAVDIDPGLASAHEELGVNLLRDNQVSRARKHLVTAHDQDPFSPIAVNTLRLLDSFTNFTLINDPEVPDDAGLIPVTLRLHKEEAAAIAPYAISLTRDGIAEFTDRYGFALREPVIIEMYPDHEDFAVRTAGMPGLGILGATFGYVVAMDSPSGRPPEQFQWGTTLWHELAHVFTLEASNHLVPRWFSEGVSVFEEWRSGPNPGVRIPMSVYNAMKDDRFLPVAELDEGFLRPTYEEQVIVSYMQAGLVCQYIDRQFGVESLRALLYKYSYISIVTDCRLARRLKQCSAYRHRNLTGNLTSSSDRSMALSSTILKTGTGLKCRFSKKLPVVTGRRLSNWPNTCSISCLLTLSRIARTWHWRAHRRNLVRGSRRSRRSKNSGRTVVMIRCRSSDSAAGYTRKIAALMRSMSYEASSSSTRWIRSCMARLATCCLKPNEQRRH